MALGFALNQVTILGSPLKIGKTKNSMNDSMKYLALVQANKENARRQKLELLPTLVEEAQETYELTFKSGNILKIQNISETQFALEIICCLKLEYENRLNSYWIKEAENSITLYILYDNKFDAVYSMQIILENYGYKIKDDLE